MFLLELEWVLLNQEEGSVSVPLITILIPTYNRPQRIRELLGSFLNFRHEWPESTWEILISENCNVKGSQLTDLIDVYSSRIPVRIVNPAEHLVSAEENLFFGWQFATGQYVWILGDDDPVNFFEIDDLVHRCQSKQSNVFKFNSKIISHQGEKTGDVVTKCSAVEISIPFLEFIQKVGMWHTAAGFSTWIIKRELLDGREGLNWIGKFRSPVYSHVTYFIFKLFKEKCIFVNKNLVNYRTNAYAEGKDDHWGNYTRQAGMPRYFPWTLGFVEQLLELENLNVIPRQYWGSVVGDHFGVPRFLEFNSMVNLALLQLNVKKSQDLDLNEDEWMKLINYFASIRPDLYDFWFLFLETNRIKYEQKASRTERKFWRQNTKQLQSIWTKNLTDHPFEAFKRISINGWDIYDFPNSHFAIPEGNKTLLNLAVELVPPKHRFIVQETSYEKLLEKVLQMESPEVSNEDSFSRFGFLNQLARLTKASGIWLPGFIKNFGKKLLK